MILVFDFEMQMSWFDLRLANNYTQSIRIWEKNVLDAVWKPDPYFVNSKEAHYHVVSFPNFRMRISPNGLVVYSVRFVHFLECCMTIIFKRCFTSFLAFFYRYFPEVLSSEISVLYVRNLH